VRAGGPPSRIKATGTYYFKNIVPAATSRLATRQPRLASLGGEAAMTVKILTIL